MTEDTNVAPQTPMATENQVPDNPETKDDAKTISRLKGLLLVPPYMLKWYRQMEGERKYVAEDCFIQESTDSVTINHILRNQETFQAYIGVFDPKPEVLPARKVGNLISPAAEAFAETAEIFLSQQAELMRMGPVIEGGVQDASTNGLQCWKLTLQTDYSKDPVGRNRFGDQQIQANRYQALKEAFDEGKFGEEDVEYATMMDLEKTLRLFAALKIEEQIKAVPILVPKEIPITDPVTGAPVLDPNTMQPVTQVQMVPDEQDPREVKRKAIINGEEIDIFGLPEIPAYVGFTLDPLLLEDVRWDWSITRPEQILQGGWIANRTFMLPAAIGAKWQVPSNEMTGIALYDHKGAKCGEYSGASTDMAIDPSLRTDVERPMVNGSMAVWEVYHRDDGRRYVFVEGMNKLLVNEVFQTTGRQWFPFFFYWKHRVTGNALPISDVTLSRNLQDASNNYRSWLAELVRASLPSILVPTGTFDKATMELWKNRRPIGIVEFDKNKIDDIAKAFKETAAVHPDLNGLLAAMAQTNQAIQMVSGVPTSTQGVITGATATESAMANSGLTHQVDTGTVMINRVISEMFQYMLEIAIKVFPESHMKLLCGDAAVWPKLGVEEIYSTIYVTVRGGIRGKPDKEKLIPLYTQLGDIIQKLGLPINGIEILRDLLESLDVRRDFRRYIALPQAPLPLGSPGYQTPVGQAPAAAVPPGTPTGSDGRPNTGGAPPMEERPTPSDPSQIPNHPPNAELPP